MSQSDAMSKAFRMFNRMDKIQDQKKVFYAGWKSAIIYAIEVMDDMSYDGVKIFKKGAFQSYEKEYHAKRKKK
jgi:hypothetical protein